MALLYRCLPLLLMLLTGTGAAAQISGVVYRDFNASGTRQIPGEVGVGGVTITVLSSNLISTTVTSSTVTSNTATTGTYSITPGGTAPFRVTFASSTFPAGYFPAPKGTGNGTAVQFIATATQANVNLGINHPADYTQANPALITACYVNGDPLGGGTAGTTDALVSVLYSATGNAPVETYYGFARDVGAVWGLAYQRSTSKLYSAAFIKRHSGLGTGGSGAIYVTTPGSGTFTSAVYANLDALGFSTGNSTIPARGLPAASATTSRDALAIFDMVGKAGLGDLDISDDGTQIYTVNLFDRKLYRIPATVTPTAGNIASFALPAPNPTCIAGSTFRPFATKYYRDRVYVGGVCTNEAVTGTTTFTAAAAVTTITVPDTTGLKAVVFEFNPGTSTFTQVLTAPMTYRKGAANSDKTGVDRADRWFPWNATVERFVRNDGAHSYPQPILADIEFDVDGSMILGIRDRFGEQYGYNNLGPNTADATLRRSISPGDILRAGKCGPGNLWTLENGGKICGVAATTLTTGNNQGPGGKEYYFGDQVAAGANHIDIGLGGLALIPGTDEVAMTAMDPTDVFDTGGIRRLQNSTGAGSAATSVQLVQASAPALFGKGNSLGDLEVISNPAPIEIGNRIWNDGGAVGADGLQGPSPISLGAVTVQLFQADVLKGTATTDVNGEYYFNSVNVTGGLLPNTAYEIRVPLSQTVITSQGYVLTQANVGTDDEIDSDATTVSGNAVIALTTGDYGSNNHSYDIGFVTCPTITNPSASQTVCSGVPVGSLKVTTTATGTGVINFVYYTSPQSGTAIYSGGTSLTTVTPASGSATATNVAFPANTGTTPVIYYVYARLNPAPGSTDCQPSALMQVTVNPVVVANATSTTITCAAPAATVSGTSNIAGSTFAWTGPASFTSASQSFTTSTPGTYTLVATANGCPSAPVTTTVTSNTVVPSVSVANDGPLTCAKTTVTVSATVSGFATTYNYRFNGGSLVTNQSSATLSFPVSVSGSNTLSVTATNGCSASATTTVTQNITPPVVTASNTGPLTCTSTAVTVAASTTTAGATYVWNTGQTTASFSTSTPGVYSVTVTAPNGCTGIASTTVTQDVTAPQNVTATNTGPLTCTLTSVTVSAATSSTGVAYRWSSGQTTSSFTTTTPGVYSVTLTSANGCTATTSTTVTSNTLTPSVSVNSLTLTCAQPSGVLTATATNATSPTYRWSTGATTASISVTASGPYSVTVSSANGCTATTSTTVVSDTAAPSVTASNTGPLTCTLTTVTVAASTTTAGATYVWSSGQTTASFSTTTPGVYSVTVTAPNGCTSAATTTVTSNTVVPSVSLANDGPLTCAKTTVTVSATVSGFATTYNYRVNGGSLVTNQSSAALSFPVSVSGTNTLSVTATNGCSASAATSVAQNITPPQTLTLSVSRVLSCTATTAVLTASSSSTGVSYAFAGPGIVTTSGSSATVNAAGTYSVTATGANGCTVVTTATVTQDITPPVVSASNTGPLTCTLTTVTVAASTTTAGATYRWSSGQTTASFSTTVAGVYSVTVTAPNGCTAVASTTVTSNTVVPDVSATGGQISCQGTSIQILASSVTPNVIYSWTGPGSFTSTVQSPTASTVGTYTVVVTNTVNGCTARDTAIVSKQLCASLGNYVFEDINANGIQDGGDPGINGATVQLFLNGSPVASTTTTAGGVYSFTGLTPGAGSVYTVGFGTPTGYTATVANTGSDLTDSDADPATGLTGSYTLAAGETNNTVDAGYYRPAAIGDRVFVDANRNGLQDAGEVGLSGVTVTLVSNGTVVTSTTTNASGLYSFTGLTPGVPYSVSFTTPATYTATAADQGGDDSIDSDAINGSTASFTLSSGQTNNTNDAGFYLQPAALGNYVFEDLNANGVQDAGEPGINGVTVSLYQSTTLLSSTTTNASGIYSFTGLVPGTPYQVQFTTPSGYTATAANVGGDDTIDSDADAVTGRTSQTYSLTANETNNSVDAGYYRPAAIGDRVFVDANRNGLQDGGEVGLAGVAVQLLTGTNTVVASTTTNATGIYSFTGLTPGVSYSVTFGRPTNYSASPADVTAGGGTDLTDSDANPVTGRTGSYSLTSNETNNTVDAGFYLLRYDVALRKTITSQPNPVVPGSLVVFNIETTNQGELPVNGSIIDYVPAGFTYSQAENPGWSAGPNPTLSGTLQPGQTAAIAIRLRVAPTSVPVSLTNAAEISTDDGDDVDSTPDSNPANDGTVTDDAIANENGDEDDHDIAIVNVVPFAALGDRVFEDANANGIQDAGETGIAGVAVSLYQNTTLVASTTTNATGIYSFTGLTPGAAYQVQFGTPSTYTATLANQGGDDSADSDADATTGRTGSYSMNAGETNNTVDAGFYRPATIGDNVFGDANRNGIQDGSEAGIAGVTVQLLTGANTVVASTTTNGSGIYSFTGLTPGVPYSVAFGTPTGYTATTADQGGNDAFDSDADPTTGRTGSYTLTSNETNNTVDAGFYCVPPQITATGGILTCVQPVLQLQATSNLTPSTYQWTGPAGFTSTAQNPRVSSSGTYTVVVTSNAGCAATATDTAIVGQNIVAPVVFASNDGPLTCAKPAVTVTASTTTAGATYRWSSGQTTASFSTTVAGTYSVTVTGTNGCTATAATTVTQPPALSATTVQTNIACNGGNTGSATVTATGGAPAYQYRWSNRNGEPGATTSTASGLTAGVYSVTVTDANTCTLVKSVTLTEPPALTLTAVVTNVTCNGSATGSIDLSVSGGTAPYQYSWSNGNGQPGTITQDITTARAGSYTVTVTDQNNCVSSLTATISEPQVLTLTTTKQDVTCNGGSDGAIDLTVTGGSTPYTYQWTDGNSLPVATTQDLTNRPAGAYNVLVTDANGCTATARVIITQPAAITLTTTKQDVSCNGSAGGSINLTVSGGNAPYAYGWRNGSGQSVATTKDLTGLTAGTYSVTVTDANSCTATTSVTITQPAALTLTAVGTNPNCSGGNNGSINLTVSGGTAPYQYVWNDAVTSEDRTGLRVGSFSVVVTDVNSCTATTSVTLSQPDSLNLSGVAYPVTCHNGTDGLVNLTVLGGTAPYAYYWTGPNGFTATTQSIESVRAGSYNVTVTDAAGCGKGFSIAVSEPDSLIIDVSPVQIVCNGKTADEVTTSVRGGVAPYTYYWTGPNSFTATTPSIYDVTAGSYTLVVTDANACSDTEIITINQPPPFSLSTQITPVSCFGGSNGAIDVTVTGATPPYSFTWTNASGMMVNTTEDLSGIPSGTYSLSVTDRNNCVTSLSAIVVSEPTEIVLSQTHTNVTCFDGQNGTIDLTVQGGIAPYNYVWNDNVTTEDRTGLRAGVYTVTVTDNNGCQKVLSLTITQPPAFTLTPQITNVSCNGGTNGAISLTATGGTGSLTYRWSTGATTASISSLTAGIYSVTVTDASNCSAEGNFSVTQPAAIVLTTTQQNINCNGATTGSITATVSGGTAPYQYAWSTGATTASVNSLTAGVYSLTVTDANACTKITSVTISQPPALTLTTTQQNISCFGGNNGSIDATTTGGTAPYAFRWNDNTTTEDRTGLVAGVYSLTATDSNGCTAITSVTITQPDLVSVTATNTGPLTCAGRVVTVSASSSTTGVSYQWTGPAGFTASTASFTTATAGTYVVTVTGVNGCPATSQTTVGEDLTAPVVSVNNTGPLTCANPSATITATSSLTGVSYRWSSGQTTASFSTTEAGVYSVTVTGANGCTATASTTVILRGVSATLTQGACNGNSTNATTADDFYTITTQATTRAGGASNRYEVVLNASPDGTGGTILNAGGTTYGQAVIVGGSGTFRADGTTSYVITIRDLNNQTCRTVQTTAPVASCSDCQTVLCPIVTISKR